MFDFGLESYPYKDKDHVDIKIINMVEVEVEKFCALEKQWEAVGQQMREQKERAREAMTDAIRLLDKEDAAHHIFGHYSVWPDGFYATVKAAMARYHKAKKIPLETGRYCFVCDDEVVVHSPSAYWQTWEQDEESVVCLSCARGKQEETRRRFAEVAKQRSLEHKAAITSYRAMPYKEYLQTDHWKSIRATAMRKAGYKCHLCESNDGLNVHHKNYRNIGCEQATDLVVLCRACHATFHDKPIKEESGD